MIHIQHRALAGQRKALSHMFQRDFYVMGNTGLIRRDVEMAHLQPALGQTRYQELRNSPISPSPLFQSQLVMEGEESLLKKELLNNHRASGHIKISFFVAPTATEVALMESASIVYGGHSTPNSKQLYSSNIGNLI